MIFIAGDWEKDRKRFDKAVEHLIQTEKYHSIYHDADIINIADVYEKYPFLDYEQKLALSLTMLSFCDIIYMLKSWENHCDARLWHEYACAHNYKIIYSKKF